MNNSINVQSPSFGMAYKIGNKEKLCEAINNLPVGERAKLAEEMKMAKEKLAKTRFADVITDVFEMNGKTEIGHLCDTRIPMLNSKGGVVIVQGSTYGADKNLSSAVNHALGIESAMQASEESLHKFDGLF